jgi:hypothetical protein
MQSIRYSCSAVSQKSFTDGIPRRLNKNGRDEGGGSNDIESK